MEEEKHVTNNKRCVLELLDRGSWLPRAKTSLREPCRSSQDVEISQRFEVKRSSLIDLLGELKWLFLVFFFQGRYTMFKDLGGNTFLFNSSLLNGRNTMKIFDSTVAFNYTRNSYIESISVTCESPREAVGILQGYQGR